MIQLQEFEKNGSVIYRRMDVRTYGQTDVKSEIVISMDKGFLGRQADEKCDAIKYAVGSLLNLSLEISHFS